MKKLFLVFAMAVSALGCNAQTDEKPMTREELMTALSPLIEQMKTITESQDSVRMACLDFANKNLNGAGAYVVQAMLPSLMKPADLIAYIDGIEYYKNNKKVQGLVKNLHAQEATSAGKMYVDFSAEYEGKVSKLSDYVGKGKYVLADFWASWCGPCKAEVPNLIKVHNKYAGEKFTVLGVATWDKPEATLKAMEQLGINYPQIMNAQQAGSDAYGIQGIPEIILFAPDGTILHRGLRGEKIEKVLKECLGE